MNVLAPQGAARRSFSLLGDAYSFKSSNFLNTSLRCYSRLGRWLWGQDINLGMGCVAVSGNIDDYLKYSCLKYKEAHFFADFKDSTNFAAKYGHT